VIVPERSATFITWSPPTYATCLPSGAKVTPANAPLSINRDVPVATSSRRTLNVSRSAYATVPELSDAPHAATSVSVTARPRIQLFIGVRNEPPRLRMISDRVAVTAHDLCSTSNALPRMLSRAR
jgi:hypothetical protein